MFLFRMHSVGSVRPRLSLSDAMSRLCENNDKTNQNEIPKSDCNSIEIQEDVVVIQEEEMVLVRKESPEPSPVQEDEPVLEEAVAPVEAAPVEEGPHPQCIEPEPTMSSSPPPKPKTKQKKKQQKRR